MAKDLTSSHRERQNILNNRYALQQAEKHLTLGGVLYEGEPVFTKQQVIEIFDVSESTIEKYLALHGEELRNNGYRVLKGAKLRNFKAIMSGTVINYGTKTTVLGVFTFRAVLNLAMLISESAQAAIIRSRLLDIVIDVMTERVGGHTKYINQREENYLIASFQEENYRRFFTDALDRYVEDNKWKYARFTNKIYQAIFKENATEYRKVLNLAQKAKIRETMYSELLTLIASFESGVAYELQHESERIGRILTLKEAEEVFDRFGEHPLFKPLIIDARTAMANRDLCFRDALHDKLEKYIESVPESDFERFLGETSKSLEERLSDPETLAVFKRLKDR